MSETLGWQFKKDRRSMLQGGSAAGWGAGHMGPAKGRGAPPAYAHLTTEGGEGGDEGWHMSLNQQWASRFHSDAKGKERNSQRGVHNAEIRTTGSARGTTATWDWLLHTGAWVCASAAGWGLPGQLRCSSSAPKLPFATQGTQERGLLRVMAADARRHVQTRQAHGSGGGGGGAAAVASGTAGAIQRAKAAGGSGRQLLLVHTCAHQVRPDHLVNRLLVPIAADGLPVCRWW